MTDNKKKLWIICGVVLIILVFWAIKTQSKSKPYIFINETEDHRFDESIRMSIQAATKRTNVQNVVVITNRSLDNKNIDELAVKAFKELEVGKNYKGRGILFLYQPQSHALKIEVGYALEGVLPDIKLRGLELAAKSFIYSDRYQDFWAELINTLNIEIYEEEHSAGNKENIIAFDFRTFHYLSGGAGLTSGSYQGDWENFQKEFKKIAPTDYKFKASDKVEDSLAAYLQSLKQGIGDAHLDILSPESVFFRETTPMTTYQLYRNWRMYDKSGVDKIFQKDNLAFVFFKPNNPVLPIVFKKSNGRWRVQEALSWSLFQRFEDSMKVFLKYSILDISTEMDDYLRANLGAPLYPAENGVLLKFVSSEHPTFTDIRSLYFNFYWLPKVVLNFDLKSAKSSDENIWLITDSYMNLGQMTSFVQAYEIGAMSVLQNQNIQKNLEFYKKVALFNDKEWRLKWK